MSNITGAKVNNSDVLTFYSPVPLEPYRRVKIKAGTNTEPPTVEYAGATDIAIGHVEPTVQGKNIPVRRICCDGWMNAVSVGTIHAGDELVAVADGKVAAATGDVTEHKIKAVAYEDAAAADLLVRVLYTHY